MLFAAPSAAVPLPGTCAAQCVGGAIGLALTAMAEQCLEGSF